jgi:hypothetical protein
MTTVMSVTVEHYVGESYVNTTGNVRINITLMRVHVTTGAVEKQYALHILSVCL